VITNQIKQKIAFNLTVVDTLTDTHKIEIFPSSGILDKLQVLIVNIFIEIEEEKD